MAHSARLVRGIVKDRLAEINAAANRDHPLLQVRRVPGRPLRPPGGSGLQRYRFRCPVFRRLRADARLWSAAGARGNRLRGGPDSWRHMPPEHPLMRTALRVLSLDEVVRDAGIGFTVMCDTINSFASEILAVGEDGRDPILYFYEYFLATFDPVAEKYGVYYTPVEVVRYIVAALDRALRESPNAGAARPARYDPRPGHRDRHVSTGHRRARWIRRPRRAREWRRSPCKIWHAGCSASSCWLVHTP